MVVGSIFIIWDFNRMHNIQFNEEKKVYVSLTRNDGLIASECSVWPISMQINRFDFFELFTLRCLPFGFR